MKNQINPAIGSETGQHIADLAKAYGNQIVRRDNKFYDIDRLGIPLSRNDVEMMILNRIRDEHPNVPLSKELLKGLFKLLIEQRHTDTHRSFQVWNGASVCEPGNPNRLIMSRGAASANVWSEPEYRSLKVNSADFGIVEEFLAAFFQCDEDRNQFLNWLTWCLQNESDKPAWAPFLYSRGKGTGKSTICRVLSELFGVQNTAVQNNLNKLTQQFNATILTSKLVIS